MAACLESLSLASISNIIRSVASLIHEASESDKDGEFLAKNHFLHFMHSYSKEAAQWTYLVAVMDSPCA